MKNMQHILLFVIVVATCGLITHFVYSDWNKASLEEIIEVVDDHIKNNKKINEQHTLIQAILKKDLDGVKKALENGAKIDYKQDNKEPLFSEGAVGNLEDIDINDIDIDNKKEIKGESFLLELSEGITPLGLAIQYSSLEIVNYLLEVGANPNLDYSYGTTPLMTAAMSENDNALITKMLLKYNARHTALDADGYSALYFAYANNNKNIMETLVEGGANINKQFDRGQTLLFKQVDLFNSNNETVKHLLRLGANPNIADENGTTPLMLAIEANDDVALVELLLQFGANPNLRDSVNKTALNYAIDKRYKNKIESLLFGGANVSLLSQGYRDRLNEIRFPLRTEKE